jgi:hypothetical protein
MSLSDTSTQSAQVLLVQHITQEIQALRSKYSKTWSPALELNLQGTTIYLIAHSNVLAEDQARTSDTKHFITTITQQGFDASLTLIKTIRQLGENASVPLLTQPKQHFRLAFFASLFLLKYLDSTTAPSSTQDSARNAVMLVYHLFMQYHTREEFQRAARTLEVLARFVVPGERRIKTIVKSRMGASLNYNAIWTVASLRGGEADDAFTNIATAPQTGTIEPCVNTDTFDVNSAFPWGLWDDVTFEESVLGATYQLFSDFSMSMDAV